MPASRGLCLALRWSRVVARGLAAVAVFGPALVVADAVWWVARRLPAAEGTGFEPRRRA